MNNFKDFICHGCLKKYKYKGDFKELVNKQCPHCMYVVWTQEEHVLLEKLERAEDPITASLTIASLSPLEKRLFQYWVFVATATTNIETSDEDFVKDLI